MPATGLPIVEIRDAYKIYGTHFESARRATLNRILFGAFLSHKNLAKGEFFALDGVSFSVQPGEKILILGHNGAGRNTLVKTVAGLLTLNHGFTRVRGQVRVVEYKNRLQRPLQGLQAYAYDLGSFYGMQGRELNRFARECIEITQLQSKAKQRIIDSDPYDVRQLTEAIVFKAPADIFIFNGFGSGEVPEKFRSLLATKTVFWIPRSSDDIPEGYGRALVLQQGALVFDGPTAEALKVWGELPVPPPRAYGLPDDEDDGDGEDTDTDEPIEGEGTTERPLRGGDGTMRFTTFRLLNGEGHPVEKARTGEDLIVELKYAARFPMSVLLPLEVSCVFADLQGNRLFGAPSKIGNQVLYRREDQGTLRVRFPKFPLIEGKYEMLLSLAIGRELADKPKGEYFIEVTSGDYHGTGKYTASPIFGAVCAPFTWMMEDGA